MYIIVSSRYISDMLTKYHNICCDPENWTILISGDLGRLKEGPNSISNTNMSIYLLPCGGGLIEGLGIDVTHREEPLLYWKFKLIEEAKEKYNLDINLMDIYIVEE